MQADAKLRDRGQHPMNLLFDLPFFTDGAGQVPPDCGKKFSSHRSIVDGTVLTHERQSYNLVRSR